MRSGERLLRLDAPGGLNACVELRLQTSCPPRRLARILEKYAHHGVLRRREAHEIRQGLPREVGAGVAPDALVGGDRAHDEGGGIELLVPRLEAKHQAVPYPRPEPAGGRL